MQPSVRTYTWLCRFSRRASNLTNDFQRTSKWKSAASLAVGDWIERACNGRRYQTVQLRGNVAAVPRDSRRRTNRRASPALQRAPLGPSRFLHDEQGIAELPAGDGPPCRGGVVQHRIHVHPGRGQVVGGGHPQHG